MADKVVKGRIVNYRGGVNTHYSDQIIVMIDGCGSKEEASKYIGSKVEWTTPTGKKIIGKIRSAHGKTGSVIVRFNKGLPGQALGSEVGITACAEKPK